MRICEATSLAPDTCNSQASLITLRHLGSLKSDRDIVFFVVVVMCLMKGGKNRPAKEVLGATQPAARGPSRAGVAQRTFSSMGIDLGATELTAYVSNCGIF